MLVNVESTSPLCEAPFSREGILDGVSVESFEQKVGMRALFFLVS